MPRVDLGFAVDSMANTGWTGAAADSATKDLVSTWRRYLAEQAAAPSGPMPHSAYWSADEQARWPYYDLAQTRDFAGFDATIIDARRLDGADSDAYVIRTQFAEPSPARGTAPGRPVSVIEVLARRVDGHWRFQNMLPSRIAGWPTHVVGRFTYVVQPGTRFERQRALRAIDFADSLADAFSVPRVDSMTYFMVRTMDDLDKLRGRVWAVEAGPNGGLAVQPNRQLFAADPTFGEMHKHELAHYVLAAIPDSGRSHEFIGEGVATWLGGTIGLDGASLREAYAAFLRTRPDLTLDQVIDTDEADLGRRPAGAILCKMVFDAGGQPALRALLRPGSSNAALRATAARLLGQAWPDVARAWKTHALAGDW